jgi:hypothetical protein
MMNNKNLAGILIFLFIFIMGCAAETGSYGKVKKQSGTEDKITLAELRDNWDDYDIYYAKRSNRWADAIMFDPKNNGTKLTGDSWIKIDDQETLDKKIKEVKLWYNYKRVYLIEGEDNQVFGYMFYPYYLRVPVEIVDEQTLYVGALPRYRSAP